MYSKKRSTLNITICSLALLFAINFSANCEEKFGGLGLTIAQLFDQTTKTKAGELVVLDVMQGTDAQTKGIVRGDVITKIDGENTKDANFETLVKTKLRGAVGSEVTLVVKRAGTREPLTFKVRRSEIKFQG